MHIFEKPNMTGDWTCPICGTKKEGSVFLAAILGTQVENSSTYQAEQIHVECAEFFISKEVGFIGMKIRDDQPAKSEGAVEILWQQ